MGCKCTECGGSAETDCLDCEGGAIRYAVGETEVVCDCRRCSGRGRVWCDRCDGTGFEPEGDATADAPTAAELAEMQAALAERCVTTDADVDAFANEALTEQVAA